MFYNPRLQLHYRKLQGLCEFELYCEHDVGGKVRRKTRTELGLGAKHCLGFTKLLSQPEFWHFGLPLTLEQQDLRHSLISSTDQLWSAARRQPTPAWLLDCILVREVLVAVQLS